MVRTSLVVTERLRLQRNKRQELPGAPMTDALQGLREKMKFDRTRFDHETKEQEESRFSDPASLERVKMIVDIVCIAKAEAAQAENLRIQSIVLKEVGELVEALEYYANQCPEQSGLEGEWEPHCYGCHTVAMQALAKFRGGNES